MTAVFDRMAFVRATKDRGIPTDALEAVADALHAQQQTADLATKADLSGEATLIRRDLETQITLVRRDLETQITLVRRDLETQITLVRRDLDIAVQQLTIRLGGMVVALGAFLAALKFFG